MAYAGQTAEAFRRTDYFLFFYLEERRTVPGAGPAVYAFFFFPSYFCRAQKAQKSEQRPVRTKVPAPEVLVDQGKSSY
jgi:hypothetical protein